MVVIYGIRYLVAALLVASMAACGETPTHKRFLSVDFLSGTGNLDQPVAMSEFAEPPGAEPADIEFTGTLMLENPAKHGRLEVILDPHGLVGMHADSMPHLPSLEFSFIQRGADLVPVRRGVIRTKHPYWEYILQPGRVWQEEGNWSRASLPFSLQERVANCTHNGVMTWAFDDAGNTSRVAYQISSETCGYLQVNMWGVVPASFRKGDVAGADEAIRRLDAHRDARLRVKPITVLADDYPGFVPANIGAVNGVKPNDMTVYGFVVDGVHYRSDCQTRHGPYPYCGSLPVPSYSTAKSIFAAIALMRMQQQHPGFAAQSIASLVPECPADRWADVSLEDALDMATGNYKEAGWEVDEHSTSHVVFLEDPNHTSRVEFACTHFDRRAEPGKEWVYHTSDTYLLGTALQSYISRRHDAGVDLYDHVIAEPIWSELELSPLLDDTKRTYDDAAQPFAGYGLTYETDDIVRIAQWLNTESGALNGESMLDEEMLAAALFRDENDRGLPTQYPNLRYNNGFWGFDAAQVLDCDKEIWVPFMIGYGGIAVAMMPNDTIYYYFSDGYVHGWASAVAESSKIRSLCQ